MEVSEARRRFAAYIERPPADIRLAEGALLIALEAYPDLDVDAYLRRLDGMAEAGFGPPWAWNSNPAASSRTSMPASSRNTACAATAGIITTPATAS